MKSYFLFLDCKSIAESKMILRCIGSDTGGCRIRGKNVARETATGSYDLEKWIHMLYMRGKFSASNALPLLEVT